MNEIFHSSTGQTIYLICSVFLNTQLAEILLQILKFIYNLIDNSQ